MKIYNSLTRQKEVFSTITPGVVKMYTCGQTVYNDIHMGNARFYVVYDAVRRHLERRGYDVVFVQNFTDIDDKIIDKANQERCEASEIAIRYISRTLEDLETLGVKPATVNPRVTEELDVIIDMIQDLLTKGYAYESNGTVYFSVEKFSDYGKLSKKKLESLEAGKRVEVEKEKRSPFDFVLWKPAKECEPKYESPWGDGRPGWHIECSAMVKKYLGDEIDIHGGGEDLIFPHHENEIAQSETSTGKNFARFWMHCGILTADHKKMSKSSGNFFTFREVISKFPADVIRFYLLSGHYRMPMEFGETVLEAAEAGLRRIKTCYQNLLFRIDAGDFDSTPTNVMENQCRDGFQPTEIETLKKEALEFRINFDESMDDDFNTADAISAIFELVKFINVKLASEEKYTLGCFEFMRNELCELAGYLGFELGNEVQANEAIIEELIEKRNAAKKDKNFAEADRIREELTQMGISIEDTRQGVRWKRT